MVKLYCSGRSPIKLLLISLKLLITVVAVCASPADAKVASCFRGNATDVNPSLAGPAYDLGGGGPDVDEAIQWVIDKVRGCTKCSTKVDVVVIRSPRKDGQNCTYNQPIYNMKGVDSVETIVINSKADANDSNVAKKVKNAEVIFFAGGDQCQYIKNFKGTELVKAVNSVYARGGGIGGTSAGAMIQSDFVYDACAGSVRSEEALNDPYRNITFTYDLFNWANLKNAIVDTHFDNPERMGRLMTFIARQIEDGVSNSALGIGIDEGTSVVVDKNGLARVMGEGAAFFIWGDRRPEVCDRGRPLTFSDLKVWKLESGDTFDLKNKSRPDYYRSVYKGKIENK